MQVRDRTIVLTGATGGIGRHLARSCACAGARLILVGRNTQQMESLAKSLPETHLPHQAVIADLLTEEGCQYLVEHCAEQEIHILINNAGVSGFGMLEAAEYSAIDDQITLNLVVPILLTHRLLPQLYDRDAAAIVNIGSAFGSIGYPGFSVYSATKFGLRGFSEALRRELADSSISVLHVAPRATRTGLNSEPVIAMNRALGNAMDDPARVADIILRRVLAGRWGHCSIGIPEGLYAFINSILPGLIDRTLHKQLPVIRKFAAADPETLAIVPMQPTVGENS